jgi:hypothetical protein
MTSEGKYVRDPNYDKKNAFNAQDAFLARVAKRQGK